MDLAEFRSALREHEARVGGMLARTVGTPTGDGSGVRQPPLGLEKDAVQRAVGLELSWWSEAVLDQIRDLLHGVSEGGLQPRRAPDAPPPGRPAPPGAPRRHCSPGEGAEEGAAAARRLRDSWHEELQGIIRSELGALRASLEGRWEQGSKTLVQSHRRWEQELQGIRSDVGGLREILERGPYERQVDLATPPEHELQEGPDVEQANELPDLRESPRRAGAPVSRPQEERQSAVGAKASDASMASDKLPRGAEDSAHVSDVAGTQKGVSGMMSRVEPTRRSSERSFSIGDQTADRADLVSDVARTVGRLCGPVFAKLGASEAPKRSDPLSKFVDGKVFSTMVYTAIILNCVFMVIAANQDVHAAINEPGRDPSDFSIYGEVVFLSVYFLEFIAKSWRYRLYYFYDINWRYNWLDFGLLTFGIYIVFFDGLFPGVSWIRTVRMFRLTKALRVFRLLKMARPLGDILYALAHTMDKFFWSIMLLFMILFLFSLMFVSLVTTFLQYGSGLDERAWDSNGEETTVKEILADSYGSVGTTMLHLFMVVTGGSDWSVYYEPLEPTGILTCMLFLLFVSFSQVALLNIILGIFVDSAIKNVADDHEESAERHAEEQQKVRDELMRLCCGMDVNEDGNLTPAEWRRGIIKPKVKAHLERMNFRACEVKELIDHMCAGTVDEAIEIGDFVDAVMRFRGSSSCFDMQVLLHKVDELKGLHLDLHEKVQP